AGALLCGKCLLFRVFLNPPLHGLTPPSPDLPADPHVGRRELPGGDESIDGPLGQAQKPADLRQVEQQGRRFRPRRNAGTQRTPPFAPLIRTGRRTSTSPNTSASLSKVSSLIAFTSPLFNCRTRFSSQSSMRASSAALRP